MTIVKKIPLPMSGLMLAFFALANLLKSYNSNYHTVLSWTGVILLLLITLKIVLNFNDFKQGLNHPVISSVLPTYSMGMMLMAAFLKPTISDLALILWYAAILLHIVFMLNYTMKFLIKFDIKKIFPSIFIVYVGIVVASVTAPAFNLTIGKVAFFFGLVSYVILLIIVAYRLLIIKTIPDPAKPTLAIIAAPASLCLAGYMSSFTTKSEPLIWVLLVLALSMTLLVYLHLPRLLKMSFSPGYAAFTFPLVISAIALKKANAFLQIKTFSYIITIETIIAALIVAYVFIKYIQFLLKPSENKKLQKTA